MAVFSKTLQEPAGLVSLSGFGGLSFSPVCGGEVFPFPAVPVPLAWSPQACFPRELRQQWRDGHHRRFPFFPSWRTSASFWMKTASVPGPGRRTGWSREPQPGWGTPEPERSAAIVSSEGPGLFGSKALLRRRGVAAKALLHCDRDSLRHCPSLLH